ncbi:MAG: hypothetical protein QOH36_1579 [Actinomycetota bacterium]|nr:hypothetical protein [Actinomycetota bacterium]
MELPVSNLESLDKAIAAQLRADYIYMYPPRQAYRPLEDFSEDSLPAMMSRSIQRDKRLNLYVHIPFCRQICGFCNLYTTTVRSHDVFVDYIAAVESQAVLYRDTVGDGYSIPTVYFGGGTPTILPVEVLAGLMAALRELWPNWEVAAEIAVEVDPQTVDLSSLSALRDVGFNRVNLGLQSRSASELKIIGRRYGPDEQAERVREAMSVGFGNVCVDLIYGLPGQSQETWESSVVECIELYPQTICCYPLTLRPFTGFARRTIRPASGMSYDMWNFADQALRASGYFRQSHVRWARDGGGYKQKELHWGMENLLGLGAGARSYLWEIDLRSGYSVVDRNGALTNFLQVRSPADYIPKEGFVMNPDERLRKAIVLGILNLDLDGCEALLGFDPMEVFPVEFAGLCERGYLAVDSGVASLTQTGARYRDLIVQLFISETVRRRVEEFDYDE